jgi:hypothetical protein
VKFLETPLVSNYQPLMLHLKFFWGKVLPSFLI